MYHSKETEFEKIKFNENFLNRISKMIVNEDINYGISRFAFSRKHKLIFYARFNTLIYYDIKNEKKIEFGYVIDFCTAFAFDEKNQVLFVRDSNDIYAIEIENNFKSRIILKKPDVRKLFVDQKNETLILGAFLHTFYYSLKDFKTPLRTTTNAWIDFM